MGIKATNWQEYLYHVKNMGISGVFGGVSVKEHTGI